MRSQTEAQGVVHLAEYVGVVLRFIAFDIPRSSFTAPSAFLAAELGWLHMAVFVRKLLRIGKLPDELRAEVEAEGIIHLAEYVPVTRRFSGSIPGNRSVGSVSSYVGSLVLTTQRVLATMSTVPKLAGRTIDQTWSAPQSGPVTAEISATGLRLDLDVAAVDPRCQGRLSLLYKDDIPDEVLGRLPRQSLAYTVPPEWVFRAVGVPYHP